MGPDRTPPQDAPDATRAGTSDRAERTRELLLRSEETIRRAIETLARVRRKLAERADEADGPL